MFAGFWRGDKVFLLTDIGGTPHTQKVPLDQIIWGFVLQCQGLDQDRQVMGITTDHLQKAVLIRHQGCIVDAMRLCQSQTRCPGR